MLAARDADTHKVSGFPPFRAFVRALFALLVLGAITANSSIATDIPAPKVATIGLDNSYGNHGSVRAFHHLSAPPDLAALAFGENGDLAVGLVGDNERVGVALFDRSGHRRVSFGKSGRASIKVGDYDEAVRVAIDKRGRVLIMYQHNSGTRTTTFLTRLNRNGRPDNSFGARGTLRFNNQVGKALFAEADGVRAFFDTPAAKSSVRSFESTGKPDRAFGSGGQIDGPTCGSDPLNPTSAWTDAGPWTYDGGLLLRDQCTGIRELVQPDGHLASFAPPSGFVPFRVGPIGDRGWLLGMVGVPNFDWRPPILTRVDLSGAPDQSFGNAGQMTANQAGLRTPPNPNSGLTITAAPASAGETTMFMLTDDPRYWSFTTSASLLAADGSVIERANPVRLRLRGTWFDVVTADPRKPGSLLVVGTHREQLQITRFAMR